MTAPLGWYRLILAVGVLVAGAALLARFGSPGDPRRLGPIEYEVRSDFSHIRIRRQEDVRTLLFVGDLGEEIIESQVDLEQPHNLLLPYSRFMLVSYVIAPEQRRALIVGLGGGGMLHFLRHFDPDLKLDIVEIDPVVIHVADEFFDARADGNARIINQDALKFLQQEGEPYDVIYMDAFLGASDATDASGVPLHLKTAEFFKIVQARLNPRGLVVFNLHRHSNHDEDVQAIRAAFPQIYRFGVPDRGNVIVAASMVKKRLEPETLDQRAAEFDQNSNAGFSFRELLRTAN